jgi:hypothetical protein
MKSGGIIVSDEAVVNANFCLLNDAAARLVSDLSRRISRRVMGLS